MFELYARGVVRKLKALKSFYFVHRNSAARPSVVAAFSIFAFAVFAMAGSLSPSGAPAGTMNTLAEIYDSIAGSFDSTLITADQNGSLLENLKYIEANLSAGVGSDSLDFDEFVDSMTLDANTTIASSGYKFGIDSQGHAPAALFSLGRKPFSQGFISGSSLTPNMISVVKRYTSTLVTSGLFQTIWDLPSAGGGVGGYLFANQTASSSAQNMTGVLTALTAVGEHVGTGTATEVRGLTGQGSNRNTGSLTSARGVMGAIATFGGAGTTTNAYNVSAQTSATTGTISNLYSFYAQRLVATGGTVSNWAGLGIEHLTQATNNSALLIASTSSALNIPAGNFGIYNGSPYTNYFASALGIGDSSPETTFEVVGTASVSGQSYFGSHVSISGNFELSGFVSSNLMPRLTDTYDLGTSALRWRDLYLASGSLHIGTSGDEAIIDYNVNDDYLTFKPDGSTTGFVMTDGGNFGIASSSPTARLTVDGDAIVSGSAAFGTGRINRSAYLSGATVDVIFEYFAPLVWDADFENHYGTLTTLGVPSDADYDDAMDIIAQGAYAYAPDNLSADATGATRLLGLDVRSIYEGDENFGSLKGIDTRVFRGGTSGNTDDLRGLRVVVGNEGTGMVENVYGLQVELSGNGVSTNANNLVAAEITYNGGDANDATGLRIYDSGDGSNPSYTIYAEGLNTLNYFQGNVGIASTSPSSTLSVEGTTRLSGKAAVGASGSVDFSLYHDRISLANESTLAVNRVISADAGGVDIHGLSNDLRISLSGAGSDYYIGNANYIEAAAANAGTITAVYGGIDQFVQLSATTTTDVYGSYAIINPQAGTITNAYGSFAAVNASSPGAVTNAYVAYVDGPAGGGTITNRYGLYVEQQSGSGVGSATNIFSQGSSTRNIFEGHASVGGNFELTGFVSSNLTPTVTNTYSLGTSALRWSNLFATNASISNNLEVTNIASVSQLYVGGTLFNPNVAGGWTDGGSSVYLTTITDMVGIGSGSPSEALTVDGNLLLRGHAAFGSDALIDFSPAFDSYDGGGDPESWALLVDDVVTSGVEDMQYAGGMFVVTASHSTTPDTGQYYALRAYVLTPADLTTDLSNIQLTGGAIDAIDQGSGDIESIAGLDVSAKKVTAGYTQSVVGANVSASILSGVTADEVFGLQIDASAFDISSVATLSGVTISGDGAGVATDAFGLHIFDFSDVGNANSWNIYSEGAGSRNYFAGHASVGGNFELTGFVSSNLTPTVTNTYSLGTSALRWSNLFATNASISNNLEVTNIASVSQLYVGGTAFNPATALASLSATVEITGDGTVDMLKLSESDSGKTYGMVVRDGDLFVRAPSSSAAFSSRWNILSVASNSLATTLGTPASPVLVGSRLNDFSYNTYDVVTSGKYAYLAQGDGLYIADISNPASPSMVGHRGNLFALSVAVAGKYAYVAADTRGLSIVDISNPSSPSQVGNYDTTGQSFAVAVSGRYAYDGNGSSVMVFDVANPRSPALVGSLGLSSSITDIYIQGNYAYVAEGTAGLAVVDISSPTAPVLVGTYDSGGFAENVIVSGRYAYLGDFGSGLVVVDVSNPATPTPVGSYNTSGLATGIAVAGNYVYVGDQSGGLVVIDVSNPTAPTFVASVDINGSADDVYLSGRYAYVGATTPGASGLRIVDIGGIQTHAFAAGTISTTNLYANNDVDIGSNLTVRGGLNVGAGGFLVSGYSSFASTSYFGAGASMAGNFDPGADNTYDLGSSANRWRDLYLASGSLHIGASGDEAVIDYNVNNDYLAFKPNSFTNALQLFDSGAASISNTLYVSSGGNVGIGDSAPNYKLEIGIGGDINLASSGAALRINGNAILHNRGTESVALGDLALSNVTPAAQYNVALGSSALRDLETGDSNIALGWETLYLNTGGSANIALGTHAMAYSTAGGNNVAIGVSSLFSGTNMSFNVAVGDSAGLNALGSGNIFLGAQAGQDEHGGNTLWIDNTNTASSSAFIYGELDTDYLRIGASLEITGGASISGDTALELSSTDLHLNLVNPDYPGGYGNGIYQWASGSLVFDTGLADFGGTSAYRTVIDWRGNLSIGNDALETTNHKLQVASGSDDDLLRLVDADGDCRLNPEVGSFTTTCPSDERLKKDIEDTEGALDYLAGFRIRDYIVRSSGEHKTGVIAQELAETHPELVTMIESGLLAVEQPNPYIIIRAIQEQQAMIEALQSAMQAPAIPLLAEDDTSLLDRIVALFSDMLGIDFGQGSIAVDELCVGSVCVTEEQFIEVFGNGSGAPETPTPTPDVTVSPSPEVTPDETVSPTPEVTEEPEPTPEPTPEETPTSTPEQLPEPTP